MMDHLHSSGNIRICNIEFQYVIRYEKIDHSQANMILQYGVQYLYNIIFSIFLSLQIMKVWSFLYSLAKYRANPSLFSDGNSVEKGGSVLASYVNRLYYQ